MTNLTLNQIAPHSYWLPPDRTTDRPVLGVIAGARGALIVDAGNSIRHAGILLRELAAREIEPRFAMLTHWHWDHVFGSAALNLPTFAHRETARIVAAMARLDWSDAALDGRVGQAVEIAFCRDMIKAELPDRSDLVIRPPEISFPDYVNIYLGGVTCCIAHVGGDHAHDSSVVFVPEDRMVFLGDCIYDDIYHGPRRLTEAQLFPLLERLLAFDADFYLAGHHDAPMTRAEMEHEAALLTAIGRAVERHGGDRETVLAALPAATGAPLDDDHVAIADAFLAGLRMPTVEPVL
jgi:glyoxylase-like metal-dependent hydrolase (beta-lactamase superfamily II)